MTRKEKKQLAILIGSMEYGMRASAINEGCPELETVYAYIGKANLLEGLRNNPDILDVCWRDYMGYKTTPEEEERVYQHGKAIARNISIELKVIKQRWEACNV